MISNITVLYNSNGLPHKHFHHVRLHQTCPRRHGRLRRPMRCHMEDMTNGKKCQKHTHCANYTLVQNINYIPMRALVSSNAQTLLSPAGNRGPL